MNEKVCQYFANAINILGKSFGLEEQQILSLSQQIDNILTPKQKENLRYSVLLSPIASALLVPFSFKLIINK